VDEILFDSGGVSNALLLSGTVDMTYNASTKSLSIVLTNTSANAAGAGAGILLTGLAFQLPTGTFINSGSASMTGSTAVNFSAPGNGNVSSEWGYDNNPLNSGAFLNNAALAYNTVVASMVSMTTNQFSAGSLGQPPGLGGPDFGLVSALETDGLGSGVEGIRDTIRFSLTLGGNVPTNVLALIQAGNVGLSFGSPDTSNRHSVPEPGSLSLLSMGVVAFASVVARRRKRS
jgi:hypothetical protein